MFSLYFPKNRYFFLSVLPYTGTLISKLNSYAIIISMWIRKYPDLKKVIFPNLGGKYILKDDMQ